MLICWLNPGAGGQRSEVRGHQQRDCCPLTLQAVQGGVEVLKAALEALKSRVGDITSGFDSAEQLLHLLVRKHRESGDRGDPGDPGDP